MRLFFVIAVLMTCTAVALIAAPLLRGGHGKWAAFLVSVLVALTAAGMYAHLSTWNWQPAPIAATAVSKAGSEPDMASMVTTLEQHLAAEPNRIESWLMLGKAYLVIGKTDLAVNAFAKAHKLGEGNNADAALGLGEALSLRDGGRITSESDRLFEEAIALVPTNPQALMLSGLAAAQRGDYAQARRRWEDLKGQQPSPKVAAILDARLAAFGTQVSTGQNQVSAVPARVIVNIDLAPSLAARISTQTPLYVFAQLPNQHGLPLAVKRLTAAALGSAVVLSAVDAVIPSHAIENDMEMIITARISFNGQPMVTKGDLYGQLAYHVGKDGARRLLIDKVW